MIDSSRVDLGSIQVHKKAIADLAVSALTDIEGIRLFPGDLWHKTREMLGYKGHPGIGVTVDKNNQVSMEIKVIVRYGINIPDIARQVQEIVRTAVERTIDLSLKDINVNVQGIERGKE